MCGSDGGSGFISLAGLIAAKPCSGDVESGRFEGFAAIRSAAGWVGWAGGAVAGVAGREVGVV